MITRWLLAAVHLLAFGIALGSIVGRARALRSPLDGAGLRRVFTADNWWGASALLAISTGLMRAFGGFEKGSGYYMASQAFWIKMSLFALVFALEIWPMTTFIRWRLATGRRAPVDTSRAALFSKTSFVQAAFVVAMLLAATAMARGVGE
jgi:putative membrane protein